MRHWATDHDFDGVQPDALVLVMRSFEATIASQLNREMVSSIAEAESNIVQAHMRALTWAVSHGVPVYPLVYESIVENPDRFSHLFFWLGHDPVPAPEPLIDANAKWLP